MIAIKNISISMPALICWCGCLNHGVLVARLNEKIPRWVSDACSGRSSEDEWHVCYLFAILFLYADDYLISIANQYFIF